MPKKNNFLPPPEPSSYPEADAPLIEIFKKEPLITFSSTDLHTSLIYVCFCVNIPNSVYTAG